MCKCTVVGAIPREFPGVSEIQCSKHQPPSRKEWDIQMVTGLMNHQLITNSESAKFVRCDKLHPQACVLRRSGIDIAVRPQSLVGLLHVFLCSDMSQQKPVLSGGRDSLPPVSWLTLGSLHRTVLQAVWWIDVSFALGFASKYLYRFLGDRGRKGKSI